MEPSKTIVNVPDGRVQGENEAVLAAAAKFGDAEVIDLKDPDNVPFVLSVPAGRMIQSVKKYLDEYLEAPERKRGTASFTTLDSFIAHVNRTKDADSLIFADDNQAAPALLAVYDYNKAAGDPRFGQHRAHYTFPLSDEWKAWQAASNAVDPMNVEDFAEFLEDRIVDVIDPGASTVFESIKEFAVNLAIDLATPQRLMSLSRGLAISVGQAVKQAVNLSSGEGQIVFTEEHKDEGGAPIRVPGGFAIQIPVFRGGAVYQIPVRLRYRVVRGQITWTVALHRTDVVFADAFEGAVTATTAGTALQVLCGKPETV